MQNQSLPSRMKQILVLQDSLKKKFCSLKTGNIPPEDFQFEELGPDSNLKSFGTGTLSRSQTNLSVDSPNLYQKKRELEKLVEEKKKEEASGNLKNNYLNVTQYSITIVFQLKKR